MGTDSLRDSNLVRPLSGEANLEFGEYGESEDSLDTLREEEGEGVGGGEMRGVSGCSD